MTYSKQYISQLGEETSFINSNLEKVIRLFDVLHFIFSESSFANDVVLKGGTAINLVHANLKRLSVDIDLDYQGSLERETAIKNRSMIEQELNDYMSREGYEVSPESRGGFALLSKLYKYRNAFGNIDYIKIEINFMDRIHLYPIVMEEIYKFNKVVHVKVPAKEELYGMKICALIDRSKPRDLYDVNYLFHHFENVNIEMLRKSVIFYISLDGIFNIDNSSYKDIQSIKWPDIRRELQPVISKDERFIIEEVISFVIEKLQSLLVLNENEKLYLLEFSKGNYNPSLLFEPSIAERALLHPMAKWRIMNITK